MKIKRKFKKKEEDSDSLKLNYWYYCSVPLTLQAITGSRNGESLLIITNVRGKSNDHKDTKNADILWVLCLKV